jgi:cbb3-type cytochrome oxidase maturation protein
MIPMSLILGFGFLWAFLWAVDKGQFEDTETPAYRILENEKMDERKYYERTH